MIEKQVIVTWYEPWEAVPDDGVITLVTISGRIESEHITFDHAFELADYYEGHGWYLEHYDISKIKDFKIHAWCDIETYKG